jgi:hypothetical protein
MSYSKLHSSLVHSSLWTEPDNVRILFITLLAICDRQGYVFGSRGGIERLANIGESEEDDPWDVLMSPDPDSSDLLRNPENEGRRIEEVPGGFRLLNFEYYRALRNDDDRREQNRQAQARFKAKNKRQSATVSQDKPASAIVSPGKRISEAEAEADNANPKRISLPSPTVELDFLEGLKGSCAYHGIDIDRELEKMRVWLTTPKGKGRKLTKTFVVNWLNKCEPPYEPPTNNKPKSRAERDWDELQERKRNMGIPNG